MVIASSTYFGLSLAAFFGFILFLCIYLLGYINLSIMKVIFIYPALLTFPLFLMRAVEFIHLRLKDHFMWVRTVFTVWMAILLVLYAIDVVTMIQLLYSHRMGL